MTSAFLAQSHRTRQSHRIFTFHVAERSRFCCLQDSARHTTLALGFTTSGPAVARHLTEALRRARIRMRELQQSEDNRHMVGHVREDEGLSHVLALRLIRQSCEQSNHHRRTRRLE